MEKHARISIYSVFILFFIFLIFSLMIPFGSSDDPVQGDTLHHRTATSETFRTASGHFRTVLYSGTMFEKQTDGQWLPLPEVIGFKWIGNEFLLYYKNNPNINLTLQPYVNYANGNNYTVQDIHDIFPSANIRNRTSFSKFNYKFALNMTVPQNLVENTNYIAFKITSVNGLTWDDVNITGYRAVIKDKYVMDFTDLVDSGFTLTRVGREFRIGNLTANYNNGVLYLDPTIQLQDADTENLDDTYVQQDSFSDTNNGARTRLRFGERQKTFIKFDISSIPGNISLTNITDATLYFYMFSGGPSINSHSVGVINATVYEVSNQTWVEGNGSLTRCSDPLACNGGITWDRRPDNQSLINRNDSYTNATFDENWISFNVTSWIETEFSNFSKNASFMIELVNVDDDTSFFVDLTSKEGSQAQRPYLSITYDASIINTPIDNQEVLNTLSTILNTSQVTFNQTIWYTWNDGIINTTLCNDALECQTTITFPRQGYYNLTVYGNNSGGTIAIFDTLSNLFVGNLTTYDFSSTYQGINMFAYEKENYVDNAPPVNQQHPGGGASDITSDAALDSSDNSRETTTTGPEGYIVINATINETNTDVKEFIWTAEYGATLGDDFLDVYGYIWNHTSSSWYECWSDASITTADRTTLCTTSTGITNWINSNKELFFLLYFDDTLDSSYNGLTDYIALNVTFFSNNTAPTITLVTPNTTNFSVSTNINLTYNYTDDNDWVKNVSLFLDSSINQTETTQTDLNTNLNFTIDSIADGLYNWYVRVCDSDDSCSNSETRQFRIDTTGPVVNIIQPADTASFDVNSIPLNYTVSDAGVGLGACWYFNNTGNNISIACGANTTISQDSDGTYTVVVYSNDTLGNEGSDTHTWTISTTDPAVTLVNPSNGQWFKSGTNVGFNFTASDATGVDRCDLYGNWTGSFILNLTDTHAGDTSVDVNEGNYTQTIPEGFFKWNVFCNDTNNDGAFATANFTFGVDETFPSMTLVHPQNINYTTTSLEINFTATDTNRDTCWFTDDDGAINTTITGCNNRSFTASQGSTTVDIFVNDSANNINNSESVTFFVDSIIPVIAFQGDTETDGNNVSRSNIFINVSVTETNPSNITYILHNSTTQVNLTIFTNVTGNLTFNFTSLADEDYTYNVSVRDTLNNLGNTSTRTITLDTIFPIVNVTDIGTTPGSQTFLFNFTTIEINLDSCKYSILNSTGGIDGGNENVSVTCGENDTQDTVSAFATFNLTVYSVDYAGHENSSTKEFTTTTSPGAPTGGGGAAGVTELIPVVGVNEIEGTKTYSTLEREIIFSRINEFCAKKEDPEVLAVIDDFSGKCQITFAELDLIAVELNSQNVDVPSGDLELFFNKYDERDLFQGFEEEDVVREFELFTIVLGITNPLTIFPPSITGFFPIISSEENITLEEILLVNKDIRDCTVLEGAPNLRCELISNTSVRVSYFIEKADFLSKVFKGKISITSDADPEFLEVKPLSVAFTVYNLARKYLGVQLFYWMIIGVVVLIGGIWAGVRFRKNIRRVFS